MVTHLNLQKCVWEWDIFVLKRRRNKKFDELEITFPFSRKFDFSN